MDRRHAAGGRGNRRHRVPALPVDVLSFAGLFLAAWTDNFTRVGGWTLALIGVIGALSYTVDFVAAALGAKRSGRARAR